MTSDQGLPIVQIKEQIGDNGYRDYMQIHGERILII